MPATLTAHWRVGEANACQAFLSYARMLQHRGQPAGDSRWSWTLDFSARRAEARERMQPLRDQAARIKAAVVDLKDKLERLKKDRADGSQMAQMEADIREREKVARELEAEAAANRCADRLKVGLQAMCEGFALKSTAASIAIEIGISTNV